LSEAVKLQIDLAAENAIATEHNSDKSEFHKYLNYCQALEAQQTEIMGIK
jgi:hypothetical protein